MYSGWSTEREGGLVEAAKRLGNLIRHCRAEEQGRKGFARRGWKRDTGLAEPAKKHCLLFNFIFNLRLYLIKKYHKTLYRYTHIHIRARARKMAGKWVNPPPIDLSQHRGTKQLQHRANKLKKPRPICIERPHV